MAVGFIPVDRPPNVYFFQEVFSEGTGGLVCRDPCGVRSDGTGEARYPSTWFIPLKLVLRFLAFDHPDQTKKAGAEEPEGSWNRNRRNSQGGVIGSDSKHLKTFSI